MTVFRPRRCRDDFDDAFPGPLHGARNATFDGEVRRRWQTRELIERPSKLHHHGGVAVANTRRATAWAHGKRLLCSRRTKRRSDCASSIVLEVLPKGRRVESTRHVSFRTAQLCIGPEVQIHNPHAETGVSLQRTRSSNKPGTLGRDGSRRQRKLRTSPLPAHGPKCCGSGFVNAQLDEDDSHRQ